MFIQVLRGRAVDAEGLQRQLERWFDDLSPGAHGWLGSTAGVDHESRFIGAFRFESAQAAEVNSNRAEQTQWWTETSQFLDTPRFWDCDIVDEYKGGASDNAGFVQVIQARVVDRESFRKKALSLGGSQREDVIGGVVAWDGSRFTEFVYFTSEEEARVGERSAPHRTALEQVWPVTQELEYFDLRAPWMATPK